MLQTKIKSINKRNLPRSADQLLATLDGKTRNPWIVDITLSIETDRAINPEDLGASFIAASAEKKIKEALLESGIVARSNDPNDLSPELKDMAERMARI